MTKWTKPELESMLEDVVNELDLSDLAIEEHGPLGTAPSELVKLVLAGKDKEIAALKNNFTIIKDDRPRGQQIGNTTQCSDTFIATAERQVSNAMELLGTAVVDRDKAVTEVIKLRETLSGIRLSMVCIGGPLNDNMFEYNGIQLRIFHDFLERIDNAIE